MNRFAASLTLLALFLLFPAPAPAGDFSAIVNGKSFHLGASRDWNEDNYGLGINLTYLPKLAVEKMLSATMADDSIDGIVFLQLKFAVGGNKGGR